MRGKAIAAQMLTLLTGLLAVGRLINGHWHPSAGAYVYTGWIAVGLYIIATVLAGHVARVYWIRDAHTPHTRPETALWLGMTGVMFFLCLNRQLNLQVALTSMGREFSRDSGWYFARRQHQAEFTMAAILLGLTGIAIGFRLLWGRLLQHGVAFLAIAFLLTLVIIRIISYHPVDRLFAVPIGTLNLNWVLEFAGLAMFYVGLVLVRRGPPFRSHSSYDTPPIRKTAMVNGIVSASFTHNHGPFRSRSTCSTDWECIWVH